MLGVLVEIGEQDVALAAGQPKRDSIHLLLFLVLQWKKRYVDRGIYFIQKSTKPSIRNNFGFIQ